jgi:hypothetical protein
VVAGRVAWVQLVSGVEQSGGELPCLRWTRGAAPRAGFVHGLTAAYIGLSISSAADMAGVTDQQSREGQGASTGARPRRSGSEG